MLNKIIFLTALTGVFMMCFSAFVRAVEPRGESHNHEVANKRQRNGGKKKSIVSK